MKAFWLLCMCLCATFLIRGQSFDALQSRKVDSAVFYELAYLDKGDASYLLKKAMFLKSKSQFELSKKALSRLGGDSIFYEKALNHFLLDEIEEAKSYLLRIKMSNSTFSYNEHVIWVSCLLKSYQFVEALDYMEENREILDISDQELEQLKILGKKNKEPDRAYNISLFAPGFGQAYAGYPGRGFISGIMQVGTVGFTYQSLVNGYYFTGVLTGAALFYTFYLGGARYARKLAIQKNEQVEDLLTSNFLDSIKKVDP